MQTLQVPKIKLQLVREEIEGYKPISIQTPENIYKCLKWLADEPEEHFVALHLNANHDVIGYQDISHGTLSASLVHPREVFKGAILNNAFAVVVAHNHPSGAKASPSQPDIETTEQLISSGKILGVNVVDHVIIGFRSSYSFRENKPELWR